MTGVPRQMRERAPHAEQKLIGLEALRFTAAFAVLVYHYNHFYYAGDRLSDFAIKDQPFYFLFAPFYWYGEWGVHLFWCISGFIFAWKYNGSIGAGAISFRQFVVLRLSRLYPLHFVTLLAVVSLQASYVREHGTFFVFQPNDLKHFLLNLGFASYWGFQDGMSFNGPSWSISAEVLVYVLFFATCRLTGRRSRLAVPMAIGVFLLAAFAQQFLPPRAAVFLAANFFYLGVLACHLYRLMAAEPKWARAVFFQLAGLAAFVPAILIGFGGLSIEAACLLMFPAFILVFQLGIPDTFPRLNRCLIFLGNLTYASYMLQFPMQLAMMQLLPLAGLNLIGIRTTPAFFLVYIVTVCALSRVVHLTLEIPAQTLLRRVFLTRSVGRPGLTAS